MTLPPAPWDTSYNTCCFSAFLFLLGHRRLLRMRICPHTCVSISPRRRRLAAVLSTLRDQVSNYFGHAPVPPRGVVRSRVLCNLKSILVRSVFPILSARTHLPQVIICIFRVKEKILQFFLFSFSTRTVFSYRSLDLRPSLRESNRKDIFLVSTTNNVYSP